MNNYNNNVNKNSFYGVMFLILALACAGFIFSSSLKSGAASADMSESVSSGLHSFLEKLNLPFEINEVTVFVRKSAHVAEYALFSLLFSLFVGLSSSFPRKNIAWILLAGILLASTDELIQSFVVGRSSEVLDVFIDFIGIIIGFLIVFIFDRLFKWRFFTTAKKHGYSFR